MSGRILVVEDDADIQLIVALLLKAAGYDVETAGTAEDALPLIEQARPDLMLVDLRMPGMGGFGLIERLREAGVMPALPVVVLSAQVDHDVEFSARTLGCRDFIRKPFTKERLVSTVATTMARASDPHPDIGV